MNKTERVAEATESVLLRAVEARAAKAMTAANNLWSEKAVVPGKESSYSSQQSGRWTAQ